jgi:hypothetical protein
MITVSSIRSLGCSHVGLSPPREAPRLGLTGITFITIGDRGIIAERVAYDLNLAMDVLRGPSSD